MKYRSSRNPTSAATFLLTSKQAPLTHAVNLDRLARKRIRLKTNRTFRATHQATSDRKKLRERGERRTKG